MATDTRRQLIVTPHAADDPDIGRWVWTLEDTRACTQRSLDGIDERALDWTVGDENSIGTLLYHIAAIEADWLYVEVLEQPFAGDIAALFPWDARDNAGRLTVVAGRPLAEHYRVLDAVRARLLDVFRPMSLEEFRRARSLPDYDVTPEWVIHHLAQHEAEHRGQIDVLRGQFEALQR